MTIKSTDTNTDTFAQPDTKSYPNTNPNPTTKQHAIVNNQLLESHVLRIHINSYETMLLHHFYTNIDCNCHTATVGM